MAVKARSSGCIVFTLRGSEPFFLVMKNRTYGHYDFPKGAIEPGESEEEAMRRELGEETGISKFRSVARLRTDVRYSFRARGRLIDKSVAFFLVQVADRPRITLSDEHTEYRWLRFEEAMKTLRYENQRRLLAEAYKEVRRTQGQVGAGL